MSPWAWNHHRSQKIFADRFIHPGALRGATGWHATSDSEADDIRALGFQQPICVSPNGVILPSGTDQEKATNHWHSICPATKERRVALFYGRFHRKKRVLELIELWATLPAAQWLLLIVGIPEEYTVADLQNYVINSKLQGRVVVFDGTDRPPPYAIASLFLLPSHSENFGLTVAESLVHGVPALVTDTTPWQEMSKQEAGWCVQWIDFSKTLKRVLTESQESLASRGSRGREWAEKTFSWTRSAKILVEFYTSLKAK
ncbi:MAG TPA: glycosyltransferase [Opitutaceae bacterium]|nr:glycosyltransferase [Opitutaceae bacterium]